MKSLFTNLLRGIGSLEIYPTGNISKIEFDRRSDAEKLASDWERVGGYMYSAMRQVDDEQKTKASR